MFEPTVKWLNLRQIYLKNKREKRKENNNRNEKGDIAVSRKVLKNENLCTLGLNLKISNECFSENGCVN